MKENKPLFHPTFGSRPAQIVGRDQVLEGFIEGLKEPVGSRNRCIFLTGQRGMGKTALLLEIADLAEGYNMIPALVTAYEGMNDEIIEIVQRRGDSVIPEDRKSVQGFEIGALGFSFGLSFNEEVQKNYGFRTKLTLLCDRLADYGKGVLLLVDEVASSEAMRQLGITYQHLVGEEKNVAIVMAGLPQAVSSVLNDKVLTFLNRAEKIRLGPINIQEIRAYFAAAFEQAQIDLTEDQIEKLADATEGYPYLMQLIGYYVLRYAQLGMQVKEEVVKQAVLDSRADLEKNVFEPMLAPLSDLDREFLQAMAADGQRCRIEDIGKRLNWSNSQLQPYRARLISAGIIESERRGEVSFVMPYIDEYLRKIGE